jgi:hypothetical protein
MIHLIALSYSREKQVVPKGCLVPRGAVHESGTVSMMAQLADAASRRFQAHLSFKFLEFC